MGKTAEHEELLRHLESLKGLGISVQEIATTIGVSKAFIENRRYGRSLVRQGTLEKLKQHYPALRGYAGMVDRSEKEKYITYIEVENEKIKKELEEYRDIVKEQVKGGKVLIDKKEAMEMKEEMKRLERENQELRKLLEKTNATK